MLLVVLPLMRCSWSRGGLYQSPKVQFDATCHEVDERITLEDFLERHSVTVREGPGSLATFLERVAGSLAILDYGVDPF